MKPHGMFLRAACILPDGLDLREERFCAAWMSVDETAAVLDVKVRNMGWQFIWLKSACSRSGFGRTETSAVATAIARTLNQVNHRFNSAELYDVDAKKYPGFWVAKVTIHAHKIQQEVLSA